MPVSYTHLYGAKTTGVDDLNQTIELLLNGRVDATLNAEVTYFDYLKEHPDAVALPIFPIMFVSIACGAISGFHATQSPLMARCINGLPTANYL